MTTNSPGLIDLTLPQYRQPGVHTVYAGNVRIRISVPDPAVGDVSDEDGEAWGSTRDEYAAHIHQLFCATFPLECGAGEHQSVPLSALMRLIDDWPQWSVGAGLDEYHAEIAGEANRYAATSTMGRGVVLMKILLLGMGVAIPVEPFEDR